MTLEIIALIIAAIAGLATYILAVIVEKQSRLIANLARNDEFNNNNIEELRHNIGFLDSKIKQITAKKPSTKKKVQKTVKVENTQ